MKYQYPPAFPNNSRLAVTDEAVRAKRDFHRAKRMAERTSNIEAQFNDYIMRVFISFAEEAFRLGEAGIWTADYIDSQSREFLRRFTSDAWIASGYDKAGNRLREMTNSWDGSILPDVQREFEKSNQWQTYKAGLLGAREIEEASKVDLWELGGQ